MKGAFFEPPIRLCCFQRHYGAVCNNGQIMCCLCFNLVSIDKLSTNNDALIDICQDCTNQNQLRSGLMDENMIDPVTKKIAEAVANRQKADVTIAQESITNGQSNVTIAKDLGLSESTVRTLVQPLITAKVIENRRNNTSYNEKNPSKGTVMETETVETVEVIKDPKVTKITKFKNDVAKEVISTLTVVIVIGVAKFIGTTVTDRYKKRQQVKTIIEAVATEIEK